MTKTTNIWNKETGIKTGARLSALRKHPKLGSAGLAAKRQAADDVIQYIELKAKQRNTVRLNEHACDEVCTYDNCFQVRARVGLPAPIATAPMQVAAGAGVTGTFDIKVGGTKIKVKALRTAEWLQEWVRKSHEAALVAVVAPRSEPVGFIGPHPAQCQCLACESSGNLRTIAAMTGPEPRVDTPPLVSRSLDWDAQTVLVDPRDEPEYADV